MNNLTLEHIFFITDIVGTIAFGTAGFVSGLKRDIDLFGILILTFTLALTGGLIRDTITNHKVYAFTYYYPSITVLATYIVLLLVSKSKLNGLEDKMIVIVCDAVGLSTFSISGALIALRYSDFNFFGVVFCGLISAVGGGTVRDILLQKKPFIFSGKLYGVIAVFNSIVMYILYENDYLNSYTILVLSIVGIVLRLIAYYKNIRLKEL